MLQVEFGKKEVGEDVRLKKVSLLTKDTTRINQGTEEHLIDGGIINEEGEQVGEFTVIKAENGFAYIDWIEIFSKTDQSYGASAYIAIGDLLKKQGFVLVSGVIKHPAAEKIWKNLLETGKARTGTPFEVKGDKVGEYELI